MTALHPMQPVEWDEHGVIRFKRNRIVERLLEVASAHGFDLNQIAIEGARGNFDDEDQRQLAQLIGYSVSGYGDLSYATRNSVRRADRRAAALIKREPARALTVAPPV
jgi:hypothetical protein